jgi:integrase
MQQAVARAARRARKPGRTTFTERGVSTLPLPPMGQQADYFEKLRRGLTLTLRLSYGGSRSWRVGYYVNGKPKAKTIGHYPDIGVAAARKAAFSFDPKAATAAAEAGSFKDVAEKWLHAKRKLRSLPQAERMLRVYVYPQWERMPFHSIRRGDVNALLDRLEKHGLAQTDNVLATIRGIMNWFQVRDENYVSPIVRGMQRNEKKARDRILSDEEIRAVWNVCAGTYGNLLKLALLTGSRKEKLATLRWTDIVDGMWTVATEDEEREKGNIGKVKLPQLALDIINAQPRVSAYVFPSRGGPFTSFSQCKARLDKKLPADMPGWVQHDLRRTARSLLARIGVQERHAEQVLGHKIKGVEGVYNRHKYLEEKSDALHKLATLIGQIINPPDTNNVVPMPVRTQQ